MTEAREAEGPGGVLGFVSRRSSTDKPKPTTPVEPQQEQTVETKNVLQPLHRSSTVVRAGVRNYVTTDGRQLEYMNK